MVRDAVEEAGGHLGIAEGEPLAAIGARTMAIGPFAEGVLSKIFRTFGYATAAPWV
jgi:hypothetical protein